MLCKTVVLCLQTILVPLPCFSQTPKNSVRAVSAPNASFSCLPPKQHRNRLLALQLKTLAALLIRRTSIDSSFRGPSTITINDQQVSCFADE